MEPETEGTPIEDEMAGDCDVDMKYLGGEEFPLSYLLEETPVQRLLGLAETLRREPRKVRRRGFTAKGILTSAKVTAVIRELPQEGLQEVADEVAMLKQEAEKFGVDSEKMETGIQQELNVVVSEIYSPPRVARAARLLTKLGITPGFALVLISLPMMKMGARGTLTSRANGREHCTRC